MNEIKYQLTFNIGQFWLIEIDFVWLLFFEIQQKKLDSIWVSFTLKSIFQINHIDKYRLLISCFWFFFKPIFKPWFWFFFEPNLQDTIAK